MIDLEEIKDKLDQIDEKLDVFMAQQVKNTTDILWFKRVGMVLITLVSFLGTQVYTNLEEKISKQPIITIDRKKGSKQ